MIQIKMANTKKPLIRGAKPIGYDGQQKDTNVPGIQEDSLISEEETIEEADNILEPYKQKITELAEIMTGYSSALDMICDETVANLEWLMNDSAAKASSLKVTIQNLKMMQKDAKMLSESIGGVMK